MSWSCTRTTEGDFVTSRSDTIGVPVGGKVDFTVISPPGQMNPGNKKIIKWSTKIPVTLLSTAPRHGSAQWILSRAMMMSHTSAISNPVNRLIASYDISVDRAATIKEYGLDSEIRYRDSLDNTYISDTMKVRVNVTQSAGLTSIFSNPVYLSIIVAAIIGIVYLVLHFRKKSN